MKSFWIALVAAAALVLPGSTVAQAHPNHAEGPPVAAVCENVLADDLAEIAEDFPQVVVVELTGDRLEAFKELVLEQSGKHFGSNVEGGFDRVVFADIGRPIVIFGIVRGDCIVDSGTVPKPLFILTMRELNERRPKN